MQDARKQTQIPPINYFDSTNQTYKIAHQILKYFTKNVQFHYKRTEFSNITQSPKPLFFYVSGNVMKLQAYKISKNLCISALTDSPNP